MLARNIVLAGLVLRCAMPAAAQEIPRTAFRLGAGVALVRTGERPVEVATGLNLTGSVLRMLTARFGLEVEGRIRAGSGSDEVTSCPDPIPEDGPCNYQTNIPGVVTLGELRLVYALGSWVRLSAGPTLAFGGGRGDATGPTAGITAGLGYTFHPAAQRLGVELRGTRLLDNLGRLRWLFGSALTWRL